MDVRVVLLLLCGFAVQDVTSLAYTVQDCPPHVPRDSNVRVYGQSCYYFMMNSQHDYATAKQSCKYLGGFLATVDSSNTQRFLYRVIRDDYHSGFTVWIGLRNSGLGGTFVWDNGVEANFFNWAANAETHVLQDNGCVAMDTDEGGVWKIFPCHYEMFFDTVLPFVCQIPISSECQVCGDIENNVPCTHLEMTFARYVQCDALFPYCMNDVIETSGSRHVFKRCANETTCMQSWWMDTSQNPKCVASGNSGAGGGGGRDDFRCHYCCHGNDCNRDLVPDLTTLFKPGGTVPATTGLPHVTPLPYPTAAATTTSPSPATPTTSLPPMSTTTTASARTTTKAHTTGRPAHTTRQRTQKATTVPPTTTQPTTLRLTPTPTTPLPLTTAQSSTQAAKSRQCFVCGDLSSNRPCSHLDLILGHLSNCPGSQPFCMNDISQTSFNGNRVVTRYKRCVDEAECRKLWFEGSSDIKLCTSFDPHAAGDVTCHLCCFGDLCNLQDVPPQSTWYHP